MPGAIGGGLAPFDKHPANPGALNASAQQIANQARQTVDVADQTRGAYQPAIDNWDGIGAPELRAAPEPMMADAADLDMSLAWSAVAVRYWATQVAEFNKKVDAIVAEMTAALNALSSGGTDPAVAQVARGAIIAAAKRKWYEAYETHIVAGGATTAAMLRDGPTSMHLATAEQVGLVSRTSDGTLIFRHFAGQVVPSLDGPLGVGALAPWAVGRGLTAVGWRAGYLKAKHMTYLHRPPRLFLPGSNIPPSWQYWRHYDKSRWMFQPGLSRDVVNQVNRWNTAATWAGKVAKPLTFGTAAAEQWARDSGRVDLSYEEKVFRAGAHSLVKGGATVAGGVAGGKAGVAVGAAIGTLLGGPPGAAAGAVVGGIVGGLLGSLAGSGAADELNADAVKLGQAIGDRFDND